MIWAWRNKDDNSLLVYFHSPTCLRALVCKVNALLPLSRHLSVPAIVEQNPQFSDKYIFFGFEIKSTPDVDFRGRAEQRLDNVFREIFSVHFVTQGFGYVCCSKNQASSVRQGMIFPLYREGLWFVRSS